MTKAGLSARWWLLAVAVFLLALIADVYWHVGRELLSHRRYQLALDLPSPLELASLPTAKRFDFPLGTESGALAYNAQPFTENMHLGDDLNGIGGENSDLGDPVYAVADGRVLFAREGGPGWGNIIIVLHAYEENGVRKYVQSYYAHLLAMLVRRGDVVQRGEEIATVGTADGKYLAHLHFEMRELVTPFVGSGYRKDTKGWLDPSAFLRAHRGAPAQDVGRETYTR